MSSESPVILTQGLTKTFRDFWMRPRVTAVSGLDLAVETNEVFGLLGPNGSGKSTTIKILLGLLFPTKGRAAIFGRLPTDVAIKKRIGYLPEESYLYRFLNARETLDYYGRLFGLPRAQRVRRIDELLEWVGLEAVQRRPVGEYSKGMQRRIGLAQALINGPDLLILDEPTSGLDPLGTRQIKDLILRLKEKGTTILLSSHLLSDVEDVCDRVSVLYGGKTRAAGTVDELLAESGSMRIQTPTLQPATLEKIERLIEAEEGKAIEKVDTPRQRLETFFLDIVHKAQAEGVATGGARTGGAIADFLTEADAEGDQLIDRLVEQPTAAPSAVGAAAETAAAQTAAAADAVIDQLTTPAEAAPPAAAESPSRPQAAAGAQDEVASKDDPDQGLIDDLLGGDTR